jgi:hypothetical protein
LNRASEIPLAKTSESDAQEDPILFQVVPILVEYFQKRPIAFPGRLQMLFDAKAPYPEGASGGGEFFLQFHTVFLEKS